MRNRGGIIAQVFPFSFKKFVSYFECKDLQQAFDRKLYAKANWWKKTATPGIGEMITIRTANTLRKVAEL